MTDAALSMFGSGYVWLTKETSSSHNMRILCTYNAGSPFPAAHARRQSSDSATSAPGNSLSSALARPQNFAGSFGEYSANKAETYQGSLQALPILCLKVWEHQYLPDYGIIGKEEYVRQWWNQIDWDEVLNLSNLVPEKAGDLHHARRAGTANSPPRRTAAHPLAREAQRNMPPAY